MLKQVQIDTSSNCGSKCWFCPVRYIDRPSNAVMPVPMFESILRQVTELREEGIADANVTLWLAAYGDLLLDPHLEERLSLLRKFKYKIPIITNAVGLMPKIDLLHKYKDVVGNFSINVPAGNEEDYTKHTMNSALIFRRVVAAISQLYYKDPEHYTKTLKVNVNGAYTHDVCGRSQLKYPLPNNDTDKQVAQLKELLPMLPVSDARPLCDRAGLLRDFAIDNSVPANRKNWKLPEDAVRASGCNGGDRLNSWIHVTSRGSLIGCCQDYLEATAFGSLDTNTIKQLWFSHERQVMIEEALETMCLQCQFSR